MKKIILAAVLILDAATLARASVTPLIEYEPVTAAQLAALSRPGAVALDLDFLFGCDWEQYIPVQPAADPPPMPSWTTPPTPPWSPPWSPPSPPATAVPEPRTLTLATVGLAALWMMGRKRRRACTKA